jgi:hypothetical protein
MTVRRWVEIPVPNLHIAAWLDDPTYPPELLEARRAAFLAQIDRRNREAYLLAIVTGAIEPDDASDIPTDGVTEAEDERNSRPFPTDNGGTR